METIDTDVILPLDDAEIETLAMESDTGAAPGGQKKHWFTTWKEAPSYKTPTPGARPVGRLKAGRNYFYGQKLFQVKAMDGSYWSYWWALTDDDSGNRQVWISCIYFKGGANNQPVKNLPIIK